MNHRISVLVMLACALALFAGCIGQGRGVGGITIEEPDLSGPWYAGTVRDFQAPMAIGGESDPSGLILEARDSDQRIYLSMDGNPMHPSLKSYIGKQVRLRGNLRNVTAGGVETPRRTFPMLDVTTIRLWPIE